MAQPGCEGPEAAGRVGARGGSRGRCKPRRRRRAGSGGGGGGGGRAQGAGRSPVSLSQPPASWMALMRHTPAVPLKLKNWPRKLRARCSTAKWNSRPTFCAQVSRLLQLVKVQRVWTNARLSSRIMWITVW